MPRGRKGTPVTLRMDPAAARLLDQQAEEDKRTRTAHVEWLLEREQERRDRAVTAPRHTNRGD